MSFCALTLLAITGVAFFTENEGWSAVEAFYYTLCTMTVIKLLLSLLSHRC
jgi:hypothetical protein